MGQSSYDTAITDKLTEKGISAPTAVQKDVAPFIYAGANCLFESETGTGKTLAYALPLFQRLLFDAPDKNEASRTLALLIAAPTKELAAQIKNELNFFLGEYGKALLCFGGSPLKRQIEALKEKPFAAVGSPSRLLELIQLKKIKAAQVEALVFDEADRLLSKEMSGESLALIQALPDSIQFCACSATLSQQTQSRLASVLQRGGTAERETHIRILPKENILTKQITHWAFYAEERDKNDTLRRFLAAAHPEKTPVFCGGTDDAERTAQYLALDRFKSGSCPILITSDLCARGLDIGSISHVVQMGLPSDADFFIHRAGRTGRSGNTGTNVVIGTEAELFALARLEKKLGFIVYPKALHEGTVVSADEDC